jgi:hypothetical protein
MSIILICHLFQNIWEKSSGYGIGSGNSIPGYILVVGYIAMIDAVKEIRRRDLA